MQPLSSSPVAQRLLQSVKDGATVDKSLVSQAVELTQDLDVGAARQLITDILTTSKNTTPAAREALEAFVAAMKPATEKVPSTFGGLLAKWIGKSPPPRSESSFPLLNNAAAAAGRLLLQSPKDVLAAALEKIDPVLAQTVSLDSKYSMGLAGLAKLFPELATALATFEKAEEPATALMAAALQVLPPPPPLSSLVSALKSGAVLDHKMAINLLRAADAEGAKPSQVKHAIKDAQATEAGHAFIQGFLASPGQNVAARYYDAHVSEYDARSALQNFDLALGEVSPKLAELGHTTLLMGGEYPEMSNAFDAVQKILGDRTVENWSVGVKEVVARAYADMKAKS